MTLLTTPGWLQNAGDVHTAEEMRSYIGSLLTGTASSGSLIPLGGVHPLLGEEFNVTQTLTPSMSILVKSGAAFVPGTEGSTQGTYFVVNNADIELSLAEADLSLPRIDLVVIQIKDSVYSGVDDEAEVVIITGTPASSPSIPSAPDNSISLATVSVGAGVSSVNTGDITTNMKRWATTIGGVLLHDLEANIYASSNNVSPGQLQYAKDTDRMFVWNGTVNRPIWNKNWQTYTPTFQTTLGTPNFGNASVSARYSVLGGKVDVLINIVWGSTTNFGGGTFYFSLPLPARDVVPGHIGTCFLIDLSPTQRNLGACELDTVNRVLLVNYNGSIVANNSPWTWTNGDILRIQLTYEAA